MLLRAESAELKGTFSHIYNNFSITLQYYLYIHNPLPYIHTQNPLYIMNKFAKISMKTIVGLIIMLVCFVAFVRFALPIVDEPPDLKVDATDAMIQRGAYLAHNVAVCMDCHSTRDWTKFAGPIVPGTEGMGGDVFDHTMGLPGKFYARNITPFNLSKWTDGELFRLITTGVTKENEPIFPIMPYGSYSKMIPEDVHSIIAYLRTLPSIENETKVASADFPMNLIMRTIPKNAKTFEFISPNDPLEKGHYLLTIAGCGECHTPQENGEAIDELYMAGGFEFGLPRGGKVRSANITPDLQTGIGKWSQQEFVGRFKLYNDSAYRHTNMEDNSFNTVMPWLMYKDMTTEDLEAIYTYLKSLTPVNNRIEIFTADVK